MQKSMLLLFFVVAAGLGTLLGTHPRGFISLPNGPSSLPSQKEFGEVVEIRGTLLSQGPEQEMFHEAAAHQKIYERHKLLTGSDSEVLINIGASFWIHSNSQVKVRASDDGTTELHLLAGRLKRIRSSKTTDAVKVYVSGELATEDLVQKGHIVELSQIPLKSMELSSVETSSPPEKIQGINELQIHKNFRFHQKFIEKCFIAHYTSSNGKTRSGKVWLRFQIVEKGRIDKPTVSRSDYTDEKFHNCLENVASRVRIKGYNGPQAQVEFPIDIKLPDVK